MSTSTVNRLRKAQRMGDKALAAQLKCRLGIHVWPTYSQGCACGKVGGAEKPYLERLRALEARWTGADSLSPHDVGFRRPEAAPDAWQAKAAPIMVRLLGRLASEGSGNWRLCEGYAEAENMGPSESGLILGNWNDWEGLEEACQQEGFATDWPDDYLVCDCNRAFGTTSQHWGWIMKGYIGDGDYSCADCVESDPAPYVEHLEASEYSAPVNYLGVDLSAFGYGTEPLCEVYASDASGVLKHASNHGWVILFAPGAYGSQWEVWGKSESDEREPEEIEGPALSARCRDSLPCPTFEV